MLVVDACASAEVAELLLLYVNRTAASLGARERFTDLPKARAWLEENRRSLVGGGS